MQAKSDRVAIIGAAALPIGKFTSPDNAYYGYLEHEILSRVAASAIQDAGLTRNDIDAAIFTLNPPTTKQLGFATFMTAQLGLTCRGLVTEVSQLGITGGLAFDVAASQVQLGYADYALALGIVRQSGGNPSVALDNGIRAVGDVNFQAPFGIPPIGWYALDCNRYMAEFNVTRESIAQVTVKSRELAQHNPIAQFPKTVTLQEVMDQRPIVEPLGLYEVPARGDGAICLVVGTEAAAAKSGLPYVTVNGRGFFHEGAHQMADQPGDLIAFPSAAAATESALNQAEMTLGDIDLFELYAPCTITEILVSEALGLFPRGTGCEALADGRTMPSGDIPINTSGGCLGRGHPPQITGLYGLFEIREQLLGRAGARQVPQPKHGLHTCELGNYNATLAHVIGLPQ